ncbi:MAG TPA: hypothetical protein VME19_02150 [Streptosporangiaceae bacterium]|nr:hypothetical protein [Streptosporangiaceae bacterium]
MTKFADQLYADLIREHGSALAHTSPPTASRRPITSRRVLLATGAGGLAVAATAGVLMAGGGTPAYALTMNPNGTATLAVYQASGIAQVNAKLRQLGDNVVVVPVEPGCPSLASLPAPAVQPSGPISVEGSGSVDGSITVNATGVPAGDILVVGAEITMQSNGHVGGQTGARLTSPPTPSCVSLPALPASAGPGSGSRTVSGSSGGPAAGTAHGGGSGPVVSSNG